MEQRWIIGDDDNLTAVCEVLGREPGDLALPVHTGRVRRLDRQAQPVRPPLLWSDNGPEYLDRMVETIGQAEQPPMAHSSVLPVRSRRRSTI